MQQEIALASPGTEVVILGVNRIGAEGPSDSMASGRTLPLLQDVDGVRAWAEWAVTYRDVWVLDAQNRPVGIMNLTANDLGDPVKYDLLKAQILSAAGN